MADTFRDIVGRVLLRVPQAGRFLAEDWTRNSFRRICRRKRWSWLLKYGQFLFPDVYNTGTVTVTLNSATVTGVGTTFTASMVGLQFRIGTPNPIYTISAFVSATQITLSDVWGAATAATQGYEIFRAYVRVSADFHSFVSVWDPRYNWQLLTGFSQNDLNLVDAQRSNSGNAYLFAWRTYVGTEAEFEVWPYIKSAYVLPYIYEALPPDISDPAVTIPSSITGDAILEGALEASAMWPGPSADKPNPYYRLELADRHHKEFERIVMEMEVRDEDVYLQSTMYQTWSGLPFAPVPALGDSNWIQTHDI